MYTFDSYSPAWAVLGGFGLFLFGIRYLSETLQRFAGNKFKRTLDKCVTNRVSSLIVGTTLTSILQSETIAAVLTITFVNSGLLSLYQALAVLLGTNIGTTVAMQFVGVLRTPLIFVLILLGVAAKYFSRRRRVVVTGELFLGIGFIFLGLSIMEGGFSASLNNLAASGLIAKLDHSPLLSFSAGLLMVILLQSGRATLAVIITLTQSQILGIESAFAMLAGELLGIPLMANIAALLGTPMARITAAIFLVYNFVAAVGVLYFSAPLIKLMQSLSSAISGQIIYAHAAVSVLTAVLFVPLLGCTVRWVSSWSRARKHALDIDQRASFLDERILSTPGIAMVQVREEIQRMATVCRSMLRDYDSLLYRFDAKKVTHIRLQGNVIAVLQREITEFLAKLAPNLAEEQSRYEVTRLLSAVNCLELAGDNLAMMLKDLERKKEQRINFSPAAMNDLKLITAALADLFDLLPQQWDETSDIAGNHLDSTRNSVDQIIAEAMEQHLERLAMGKCTVRGALIYNDLLESSSRFAGSVGKTMSIIRDYIR